jgi:hypothetical protein
MSAYLTKTVTTQPSEFALVVREHRALILIIVTYAVVAIGISWHFGIHHNATVLLVGIGTSELMGPLFALCGYAIYVMAFIRPTRLTFYLFTSLRHYITRARLFHALPVLVLFPLFASSFTIFKTAVPIIHPYSWDIRLDKLDLALHGGIYPWEWIQLIAGFPFMTAVINISYHLWFFVMLAIFYWLAFSTDRPQLRAQFLLSFVLSWIVLGTVLATIFSSVGPCYYGLLIGGGNPYAPLMTYLHGADKVVPVLALNVQEMLWNGYKGGGAPALGISAMPSMHVATSVLLALLGWRISRAAGVVLTLFALIIMIGAVHLGWHYALDGYVGATGAFIVWRVVGWRLSRSGKSSAGTISPEKQQNANYQS